MKLEKFNQNYLEVNTYFIIEDNHCLLIDPGSNIKGILKYINNHHLNVLGVILTHAHFDHFISCNEVIKYFDVPLYVHKKANDLLYQGNQNLSSYVPEISSIVLDKNVVVKNINEETKVVEGFKLNVLHVPGHSPDSICLYFKEEKILISGDALFKLSIGRTDFHYSNTKQLLKNIKNKLFRLPDDTMVYPGHGDNTTIGHEKKHNPYLK